MRRVAIALVHYPVLDGQGALVTTAVTNLDVHDLARSARTYGCSDYFVVHPIVAQRELVGRGEVEVWVTAARDVAPPVSFEEGRRRLGGEGKSVLILFGTGWGLD